MVRKLTRATVEGKKVIIGSNFMLNLLSLLGIVCDTEDVEAFGIKVNKQWNFMIALGSSDDIEKRNL